MNDVFVIIYFFRVRLFRNSKFPIELNIYTKHAKHSKYSVPCGFPFRLICIISDIFCIFYRCTKHNLIDNLFFLHKFPHPIIFSLALLLRLLDKLDELLLLRHELALLIRQRLNDTGIGRLDHVLHLHRLEDEERLVLCHSLPLLDEHGGDLARHGAEHRTLGGRTGRTEESGRGHLENSAVVGRKHVQVIALADNSAVDALAVDFNANVAVADKFAGDAGDVFNGLAGLDLGIKGAVVVVGERDGASGLAVLEVDVAGEGEVGAPAVGHAARREGIWERKGKEKKKNW